MCTGHRHPGPLRTLRLPRAASPSSEPSDFVIPKTLTFQEPGGGRGRRRQRQVKGSGSLWGSAGHILTPRLAPALHGVGRGAASAKPGDFWVQEVDGPRAGVLWGGWGEEPRVLRAPPMALLTPLSAQVNPKALPPSRWPQPHPGGQDLRPRPAPPLFCRGLASRRTAGENRTAGKTRGGHTSVGHKHACTFVCARGTRTSRAHCCETRPSSRLPPQGPHPGCPLPLSPVSPGGSAEPVSSHEAQTASPHLQEVFPGPPLTVPTPVPCIRASVRGPPDLGPRGASEQLQETGRRTVWALT